MYEAELNPEKALSHYQVPSLCLIRFPLTDLNPRGAELYEAQLNPEKATMFHPCLSRCNLA